MSDVISGVVGVNMASKFGDLTERRIKFEDNPTWYAADASLNAQLGRGWKVKAIVEGSGNQARILKVKIVEQSAPVAGKGTYTGPKGGGGGGKSQLSKEEWAAKDRTIQYQHAQKVGVALVEVQLANGVFKVPAKNGEAVFMTQYDRMVAYVFADIMKQDAVARVKSETEESEDVTDEELKELTGTDEFEDDLSGVAGTDEFGD